MIKIRLKIIWGLCCAILTAHSFYGDPACAQQWMKEVIELNERAVNLYNAGKYAEAIPLAQRALELSEKALEPNLPDVARSLNNLAALYYAIGAYATAEPLLQRAVAIREKVLGPNHPETSISLNGLAVLYEAIGEYAKAVPLLQRVLAIRKKAVGLDHPLVATALTNLAGLYYHIGESAKAESLYKRALAINEKALGLNDPGIALLLNGLAALYYAIGAYSTAEPLLQRALAIQEKALGPNHPQIAISLNNLAALYSAIREYAKAVPLLQRALEIREKALGLEHPDVATSLNNLAALYSAIREYAKAEPLLQRALEIQEKALSSKHPYVAGSLSNLAALAAAQKDFRSSIAFSKKGLNIQDLQIQNIFTFANERQKLQFIQLISGDFFSFLSLIHKHLMSEREAVRDGLELVLRRKGIVLDAQSRVMEALRDRLPEGARKDWDQLVALRTDLARLSNHKPEQMSFEAYRDRIAFLQEQSSDMEQRLTSQSALVAKELKKQTITVETLAKALPSNSALVEFVKIQDFDFATGKWSTSTRYLAFVFATAGEVALVDLGEAGAVEAASQHMLQALRNSLLPDPRLREQSHRSLKEFYDKIWAPLEKALGKADKVFISPDGLLNLVPLAALMDSQGRYLLERYQFAYITSGRELVDSGRAQFQPSSELLLVADPDYDQKVSGLSSQAASLRSRDFRQRFDPLQHTRQEAIDIPPLAGAKVEPLVGARATEGAVKAARSPRILHLATHGFFRPDNELLLGVGRQFALGKYENPLVRSGLAFAGANHAAEITGGEDGLLTALEVSGMDLHGTELVVLSACDTGLGGVQNGEGVFGLRRAFALAGAKNLMMSLWPVESEITANQMKLFYQNLRTMPPAIALREAQLETIAELKKSDGVALPVLWAPFILQGAHALGP